MVNIKASKRKTGIKKIVPDFFFLIQFVGNYIFTLFICHHGSTTTTEKGTHRSNWNIWTK